MKDSLFTRRRRHELWGPFALIGTFIGAAAIGILTDHASLILNGHLIACWVYGQFLALHFWTSMKHQMAACELDLRKWKGSDALNVILTPLPQGSSIFLQMLNIIVRKTAVGRGVGHQEALQAYLHRTLVLPLRIQRLGQVMVSFGMAGTLIGLSKTMAAAATVVEKANDVQALIDALMPAFSSLTLAFSTTLTAVLLGTVGLGSQSRQCADSVNLFFDQLSAQLAAFQFDSVKPSPQPPSKGTHSCQKTSV